MFGLYSCHQLNGLVNPLFLRYQKVYTFPEAVMLINVVLVTVARSPKNNNSNISASFLIVVKFLCVFCLWITSRGSLDVTFLFG